MAIRERGSSFQVSVTVAGKRYRRDFPSKPEAVRAEAEAAIAADAGRPPPWATPKAADDLSVACTWAEVLTAAERTDWARARTANDLVTAARKIVKEIGPQTRPAALTEDAIETMVAGWYTAGNTGSTVNRKLSLLRTLYKRAARKVPGLVVPKMPWQRENAMRLRYYTRDEERKIIAFFRDTHELVMADLVAVSLDTGARRSELLALTAAGLQDGGATVKLVTYKGGQRGRLVPLPARAKDILEWRAKEHPTGHLFPIRPERVSYLWNRMRDFLEFGDEEDFVFHCLRHTYASRLVQAGVAIQVVKELLGHANIIMTMRYAHLAPDNLRAAVAALEAASAPMGTGTDTCPAVPVVPRLAA